MGSHGVNLQDGFLNHVRKENIEVEVTLSGGIVLNGQVRGFDNFTIVLHADGKQHLLYKHSISQIVAPKFHRASSRPSEKKNPVTRKSPPRKVEKEKFNALDLSSVKIETKSVGESTKDAQNSPEASAVSGPAVTESS